ncbi:hypothetical protein COV16_05610, partial [Candidatus Woesearchaeota archaeon CG10_big_fil_rev_8_21_14_0_10_34_8]
MKRGQVTVFIVLGVLIILGLIFLTYIVTTKNKDTLQKTQEDVVVTSLEKADVSQYVTGCLDEALRTGIVLIGAQGGFIFPDQEYSMIPYALPSYQYNDSAGSYRVASLIQQSVLFPLAPVPLYPCYVTYSTANESNRKIMGDQCMKFYYDHKRTDFRFGNYVSDPSGKRINPGLCSSRIDDPAHSYLCDCKAGGDCTYSIQKQLEYYVTSYVKQCVDFDTFKQTVGYNVKTG